MQNKERIEKPTLVARQEFVENLVNLINESGLPLIIVQPILDTVREDVGRVIKQQYENEKDQYEKSIKKKKTAKEPAGSATTISVK